MIRDAVKMVACVDGLDFDSLMNMPYDQFVFVRSVVIQITNERRRASRTMSRA